MNTGTTVERTGPGGVADWALRSAGLDDVEPIAELRAVVMRADLERLGRYDEVRVRQRFRDAFAPGHTWVVEADGALAGCVTFRPTDQGRYLEHFYLASHVQGRGLGSAVLASLLRESDAEGVAVRLIVLQGSAARRLYERHGFTVESEDPVDVCMVRQPAALPPAVPTGPGRSAAGQSGQSAQSAVTPQ